MRVCAGSRSAVRRVVFVDEEYGLPGTGQAERLPSQLLHRSRVGLEGHDLAGEPAVLGAQLFDLPPQRLGALALRDQAQDAAIAEEGADHQGEEGDDRAQGDGLPSQAGFVWCAVFARQKLICFFNYKI